MVEPDAPVQDGAPARPAPAPTTKAEAHASAPIDEINFLELASLLKVTQNTVLERFGSALNASIFDASNIAGTLKQHGLIDFTAYYPGPNEIVVTDAGKRLIAEADAKSTEKYDRLDEAILAQLSGGKRLPLELQNTLNLRPRDLAMRLYKLSRQGFIIYELKSGTVELLLTETGFLKAGPAGAEHGAHRHAGAAAASAAGAAPHAPPPPTQTANGAALPQPGAAGQGEPKLHGKPLSKSRALPLVIAIVVVAIAVIVLYYLKVI